MFGLLQVHGSVLALYFASLTTLCTSQKGRTLLVAYLIPSLHQVATCSPSGLWLARRTSLLPGQASHRPCGYCVPWPHSPDARNANQPVMSTAQTPDTRATPRPRSPSPTSTPGPALQCRPAVHAGPALSRPVRHADSTRPAGAFPSKHWKTLGRAPGTTPRDQPTARRSGLPSEFVLRLASVCALAPGSRTRPLALTRFQA